MALPEATLASVAELLYYIPSAPLLALSGRQHQLVGDADGNNRPLSGHSPATLFVLASTSELNAGHLADQVDNWLKHDDVFVSEFLSSVYLLVTDAEGPRFDNEVELKALLKTWSTQRAFTLTPRDILPSDSMTLCRSGPYFSSSDGLRPAWRLFDDSNGAFMFPVVPRKESSRTFAIPGTAGIPVPSRLFYQSPSPAKPLSGMRVVIKDNIDMAGVPTSAGNRAYRELYGVKHKNAEVIDRLLDAGAVIIGRVKTVQFASGGNARDWIDYQAPFNPREDGYQDPSCSSAGSATAISAYSWVDVALGTDTFGSVIGPASEHGLFGLRPTLGAVSTRGVVPQSRELDTVGFFTRTAKTATAAINAITSIDITKRFCTAKAQLLYPVDFFSNWPNGYLSTVEPVILKLESFLNVKRTKVDIRAQFKERKVADGKKIEDYLETTVAHIQLYDCYHNCLPLLEEYKQKFNKTAFADPYIQYKWALGKALTENQYQEAIQQRDIFRDWMSSEILPPPIGGRDFDTILLMPNGYMDPFDRHQYDGSTLEEGARRKQGFGFKDSFVTALPGFPFFNVPVGQFPYKSLVSNRTEFLPINIAFMGPRGSEVALLQIIEEFLQSSPELHITVYTGSTPFPSQKGITPNVSL
ncbi:amidase [Pochonia chlamydosporia 170]|uniref:Amidase n=1 Tax=Pochonia chlamydosporia 170 TaxID=1380566 RepID=A0A179G3V7_METCM|nr:amidase [Pochonia chlamydosporia 170]OAQ72041.1 amidase [Pochonia chlamydosporia 170]